MILAGDVGGTKSVFGLYEQTAGALRSVVEEIYRNADFAGFGEVLAAFLEKVRRPRLDAACFGVAGPIIDGRVRMPNLPWTLETAALADTLGTPRVRLLNDLEAAAYGMLHLRPENLHELSPGRAPGHANVGLIAAGTGLGEALLYWDGSRYHPIASEGGHADFAPSGEDQIDLLRHLAREFGHVSWERVLSGPGLVNIYRFLRDTGRGTEPAALRTRLAEGDAAAAVSAAGLSGEFPICVAALDLFVSIYGAEAGNLALRGVTLGGLFVGGGIAPKILSKLGDGTFMRAFRAKGRAEPLLKEVRVAVALEPRAPLIGAAYFAAGLLP